MKGASNYLYATGNVCFNQHVQFFHILSKLILLSQLYILKELEESASCKYEYFSVILLNFFLHNLQGKAVCAKQCFAIYTSSSLFILCKFSQVKLPWVYSHLPVSSARALTSLRVWVQVSWHCSSPATKGANTASGSIASITRSYLSRNTIKVLPQHPSHVLPGMGCHLVLEQEGELAALSDAVEVAVHLVVFATCRHKNHFMSHMKVLRGNETRGKMIDRTRVLSMWISDGPNIISSHGLFRNSIE